VSEASDDSEFRIAFPIEFIIRQTPLSLGSTNPTAKEKWKMTVPSVPMIVRQMALAGLGLG
jgi:hypothetical protein